jgi:hypothetical protein
VSGKAKGSRNERRTRDLLETSRYADERLEAFAAPPNTRKLLHRLRDRERLPDVREL